MYGHEATPLLSPQMLTYPQGRVWQHSLVPAVYQMPHLPEHGLWSCGDSARVHVVRVLFLKPSLLPSVLLGQHKDLDLVFPAQQKPNTEVIMVQKIHLTNIMLLIFINCCRANKRKLLPGS